LFLAVCASLLTLLLASGIMAIRYLGQMYVQEASVRHALTERPQVLIGLWVSVQGYRQAVESFVTRSPADRDPVARRHLDQLGLEVDRELQRYPTQEDSTETALVRSIVNVFHRYRDFYIAIATASPAKRIPVAHNAITARQPPDEELVLNWAARLSAWNGERLQNADRKLVAQFASVQRGLTHALVVAFGSGLLLASMGTAYILRLERQTRVRYVELARSRHDLQELSAQLVDAQESERRTISRELHDEIGQSLGALLVEIGRLSTHSSLNPAMKIQLENMRSIAERSFQAVRNIALLLRPSMLDDLGLSAALEWLGREVSRNSEMEVSVEPGDVPEDLPDTCKVCIYRVTQAALHNAVRHSGARNASVRVQQTKEGIKLEVADDGCGFDPGRTRGLGLLGMEERVKRLGGTFRLESQPGRGTTISAELPCLAGSGSGA
jgi:signal transduction histidine kinase